MWLNGLFCIKDLFKWKFVQQISRNMIKNEFRYVGVGVKRPKVKEYNPDYVRGKHLNEITF